jgi:hypothetical protein
VFEQLFTAVLRQCTQAGLVGGQRLLVDATHIEADAALKSLRAELTLVENENENENETGTGTGEAAVEDSVARPELTLAEPRTGPTPKRTATNATAVSRTDPDGKLRHKPGQRTHLVHRGQVAVDPKRRVIVAVEAERATGSEADALPTLIGRARFAGHSASEVAADAGYASQHAYDTLDTLGATALIPPQPGARHAAAEAARARMRTATGRDAAFDRQAHAEGTIAELKRHGAGRARCRGTRLLQLQLLAAATAINLKRLLGHQDALGHAQPGDPAARLRTIRWLTDLLASCLNEIGHLAATDTSTGS